MAKLQLKSLLVKKNEFSAFLPVLIQQLKADLQITDPDGKLLFGNAGTKQVMRQEILADDECIGWVLGDGNASIVASLINLVVQKELEKKKLGSEVLNLYQEVNLIFNFSEKLAQSIGASAIAKIALEESGHVIESDNGAVVLWDEQEKKLQVISARGGLFFNEENINTHLALLQQIIFSGNSEIIGDLSRLIDTGIVLPDTASLMYAALKVKHRVMGAIILSSKNHDHYAAADLKLLTTLALQSSSAIESALLYEKSIREAREREEAMRRFYDIAAKFVPYEFIDALGHSVITDVKLGDQVEKIVTVLFSDIRNYTSLSERWTPEENFSFVCSFNEKMGPVIRRHGGFVNQFLGDAIMAIFPGNAADALSASVEMQKTVRDFNKEQELKNQPVIQIGIGMHTGPLIMGITGDEFRMDAATISDTVNTASRIESLTKYYKAGVIISEATLQSIENPDEFHLRPLGKVQVKGKKVTMGIYECFGGDEGPMLTTKLETLPAFCSGIDNYLQKSFSQALKLFLQVAAANPDDLTAHFFLNKTMQYHNTGVPDSWIGIEEMQNK